MRVLSINPHKLYEGCLQASIAHGVAVGMYPELSYEHSWDGINYSVNNSEGCRGTITFDSQYIIAVFRDDSIADCDANALDFFKDAPQEVIQLAQSEALQYVLLDVNDQTKPVISAAFWGTWERLYSHQSESELMQNSRYILREHLLPREEAAQKWNEYYKLGKKQNKLIDSLLQRKMDAGTASVELTRKDMRALRGDVEECLLSLREINIIPLKR